ncbi:MAG: hypothetical protein IPG89_21550 [Bacteroidetes bacterium]|nr:hypothetical protein [Bacteroidota bacterium]
METKENYCFQLEAKCVKGVNQLKKYKFIIKLTLIFKKKLNDLEVICKKCHYKEHFTKKGKKKPILSVKQILAQKVNRKK